MLMENFITFSLYSVLINVTSNLQEVNTLTPENNPHEDHVSSSPITSCRDEGKVYIPIPSLFFFFFFREKILKELQ